MQTFINNLGAVVRHESLNGRPYLVAPAVLLTEGVHVGSIGALFYPASELAKTPQVWNHKPITIGHPATAIDQYELQARQVGIVMNTTFRDGKLIAEAWLERDRLGLVDARVLNAIDARQMLEVSTGLFTDNEQTEGTFNGKSYSAIARNYRPDHLAILPDIVGACSVRDGCGLLRNQGDPMSEPLQLPRLWGENPKPANVHGPLPLPTMNFRDCGCPDKANCGCSQPAVNNDNDGPLQLPRLW